MRRPLAVVVRGALWLVILGCASAPIQQAYIAPTNDTITSETEEGQGDRPSHTIYVTNRSTVPIVVFGVTLSGCDNIKQRCESRTVKYPVHAGSRFMVMRVEPEALTRGWHYQFNFSWRADSGTGRAATKALADAGDPDAQRRLAAMTRADSLKKLGVNYRELMPNEFAALRDRVALMRAEPESLTLAPGERTTMEQVRILLVDKQGQVMGRTQWLRFQLSAQRAVTYVPSSGGPGSILALRPGRASMQFALAEQAQAMIPTPIADVEVPIIVAYAYDAHSPVIVGVASDADTKRPLACARVALEDSAKNEVGRTRTDLAGTFSVRAPRAGSYRARVELDGWSPFFGSTESVAADEKKEVSYAVSFGQQMTFFRPSVVDPDNQGAQITGAVAPQTTRPGAAGQLMRIAGSATMPIVEIISRAPPASTWVQFAVNAAGTLDTTTLVVPPGLAPAARPPLMRALPQLRYSAAREGGQPVCDLVRLQVTFTPR